MLKKIMGFSKSLIIPFTERPSVCILTVLFASELSWVRLRRVKMNVKIIDIRKVL